ncbi:hypothetical protein JCM11251_002892 [Rhodosporidiobolus azoricus]
MSTAPSFASSNTVWPAGALSAGTSSAPSGEQKKPKPRHRARKKPVAVDAAPPPSLATTAQTDSSAPLKTKQKQSQRGGSSARGSRTDMPWRGSGRGRGRGGATLAGTNGRGGAAVGGAQAGRPFSTVATSSSAGNSSGVEDMGSRIPFARPGQAGSSTWRRPLNTDASSSASDMPPPVSTPRAYTPDGGRGKGKGRQPDKNDLLLQEVGLKEGEEGGLEKELMQLYETQRPSPAAVAARQHLIDELTTWLNAERFHWGHPHDARKRPIKVEAFGSVRFGLGTSNSDLDLCLLDPYRPSGFVEKWFSSADAMIRDLPDIYNMRKLGRSLQRANLMDVRAIPDAAVPICKFKVMIDGHMIEADLNTNEQLGLFNSRLINSYCNLHPLVRPLSVFIKFWAKQRGLNNPSGSPTTFSSYTFILLVIAYLQKLNLLPNLQSPTLIEHTNTPQKRFFSTPKARTKRFKRIIRSVGWDVTFVSYDEGAPEGYEPESAELVELARGFFDYYGEGFNTEGEIISVWNGAPLTRAREYMDEEALKAEHARKSEQGQVEARERRARAEKEAEEQLVEQVNEGLEALNVRDAKEDPEDEGAFASAAAAEPAAPASSEGDGAAVNLDSRQADVDALEQDRPARPDSRSSEPMEYVDFEEPDRWSEHLLVVQDPFILTRNCAGNVHPDWVEELRVQMRRARDLIDAHAPLATICQNVASEPGYMPGSAKRWLERTQGLKKKGLSRAERQLKKQVLAAQQTAEAGETSTSANGAAALEKVKEGAEVKKEEKEEKEEKKGMPEAKTEKEDEEVETVEGIEVTEKVEKEKAVPVAVEQQETPVAGEKPAIEDAQKV